MAKEIGVKRKSPAKETLRLSLNLSQEEIIEIKMRALKKNISANMWVRRAILAQIAKENKYE